MERYKFQLIEETTIVSRLTSIALMNAEYSHKANEATDRYLKELLDTVKAVRTAIENIIKEQHRSHYDLD